MLAGNTARRDAAVVASLRAAGAVVVGKAALDEFALTTVGPARNPLDESLSPGGSSGGSASAVRAGMCFAAIGTDTGGSVRVPAYCCAITGLKPTHGLLPTDGVIPLAPPSTTSAPWPAPPRTRRCSWNPCFPCAPKGFRPRTPDQASYRIGIPDDLSGYQPAVRERFTAVVDRAWRHGARISPLRFPDLDEVKAAHWTILSSELSAYHRHRFGEDEDRYDRPMRDAIAAGALVSTEQYLDAQRTRGELRRQVDALFAGMDLLAVPTMTVEPRATAKPPSWSTGSRPIRPRPWCAAPRCSTTPGTRAERAARCRFSRGVAVRNPARGPVFRRTHLARRGARVRGLTEQNRRNHRT